ARGRSDRPGGICRRGADDQALQAARDGTRNTDSQAHEPPHDHTHPGPRARDNLKTRLRDEEMGQKVHPEAMRVGYIHDWKSNWFSEKHFSEYLAEDIHVREHITNKLAHAGLSDITIRKAANH